MNSSAFPRAFLLGQALFFLGFGVMALFFFTPWRACPEGSCAAVASDTIGFVVGAVIGLAGLFLTFRAALQRNRG